ncbi:MAG: hypothetical protein Q4Q23_03945 [Methanobacteriaceae archaeon]|nr:hypothetical protein [Methanobacteriaceae archaeon]
MKFNIHQSIDKIHMDIIENKKELYENESGMYVFRGAGEKTLMISDGTKNEWIKWEDVDKARQEIILGKTIKELGIWGHAVAILYEIPKEIENIDLINKIKELYISLSTLEQEKLLIELSELSKIEL